MNLLPDKQLFNNVLFQSTKIRKKDLFVDNKVQETIGDVYCPTCRNENSVYFSTKETSSFFDFGKTCCHVLNIPFENQKLKFILFGDVSTHCFVKKTSRDYESEKPSRYLKKFLANHNQ